ncbi:MAG: hypothetical protein M3310_06135 [Actinomycetota bacterium]|nr:hypothetical protein [Actinomycetota bacterium]
MHAGLGPRFALEVAFLIAVAVAAAVANLSAETIVVVMAAAWVLVCLFELSVWAEGPRFPAIQRERILIRDEPAVGDATSAGAEPEESPDRRHEPEPEPEGPSRRTRFWRRRRADPVSAVVETQADGEGP